MLIKPIRLTVSDEEAFRNDKERELLSVPMAEGCGNTRNVGGANPPAIN
jgi:hypothetical protein